MSAPTTDHKRLTPFVGTFRAEVRICTFELGGRFLRQEYKGDPNDGPFPAFEGDGYWGFNKARAG